MNAYVTDRIRNVGIVGHGDTGKTQLVSSLLFTAGMTPRLGKVAEGTTITDWDEEEIARKITIHTGVAHAEWRPASQSEKIKINFLDTPGYRRSSTRRKPRWSRRTRRLMLVDAAAGVQVVTEKVWRLCGRVQLAASDRAELDGPRPGRISIARWNRCRTRLGGAWSRCKCRSGASSGFRGVVDLISMKAYFTSRTAAAWRRSRKFRRRSPTTPSSRTKRWLSWWPRATTS